MSGYLLGFDIGSSSVKIALVECATKQVVAIEQSPATEMAIQARQPSWAEQDPELWWQHACTATHRLLEKTEINPAAIAGIGIAYQMHGLVLVDENRQVLRPSIIWCDSRAVGIGEDAFRQIGAEKCLTHLLNSPGNFTAAKLAWVKKHEPRIFQKTWKFMLPGDYLALRLTGEALTTPSGLSEGILWDFQKNEVADLVLEHFGIEKALVPELVPTFSLQGKLTTEAAAATGLAAGTPVTYRAGDQPNNALSLNVLNPGEVAATGGTSGVVYGVVDQPKYDPQSRVNSFLHVNHQLAAPRSPSAGAGTRIGILLCINGAGSQYAWVKKHVAEAGLPYPAMEQLAAQIPVGSDGLRILPFGNGAERMLENRDIGASILGLQFNRHGRAHLYRAALEGIAFAFVHGMGILQEMGLDVTVVRAGNDNLFQSAIFSQTIANLVGCHIELVDTTGAVGAAKAAGVATGVYDSLATALQAESTVRVFAPEKQPSAQVAAFGKWQHDLLATLAG